METAADLVRPSRLAMTAGQGKPASNAPARFEELYRAEHDAMVRLAALITRSQMRAEEVTHEAFVAVLERWSTLSNPGGYLRTVIVRHAVRSQRRHRRDEELAITVAADRSRSLADPQVDEMWAALGALPIKQRAAVVLRFYEDFSYDQIAQALRCPPTTARTWTRRGLLALRKDLNP